MRSAPALVLLLAVACKPAPPPPPAPVATVSANDENMRRVFDLKFGGYEKSLVEATSKERLAALRAAPPLAEDRETAALAALARVREDVDLKRAQIARDRMDPGARLMCQVYSARLREIENAVEAAEARVNTAVRAELAARIGGPTRHAPLPWLRATADYLDALAAKEARDARTERLIGEYLPGDAELPKALAESRAWTAAVRSAHESITRAFANALHLDALDMGSNTQMTAPVRGRVAVWSVGEKRLHDLYAALPPSRRAPGPDGDYTLVLARTEYNEQFKYQDLTRALRIDAELRFYEMPSGKFLGRAWVLGGDPPESVRRAPGARGDEMGTAPDVAARLKTMLEK